MNSIEDYCSHVVMRMYEDARDLALSILPIAMRVGVVIEFVDLEQKQVKHLRFF